MLKLYIDTNAELKKKIFFFFNSINNLFFVLNIENARKHEDIKFVTTKGRRNYLVPELNYHTLKFFTSLLLAIKMKKNMNKPAYLFSLIDIRNK